ncbi:hypothetical protein GGF39_002555 [Coemansia sp. RSA 1721]|nr:hypothetical protein GGF39_002555 [Coemansia sp. RSA 1721]
MSEELSPAAQFAAAAAAAAAASVVPEPVVEQTQAPVADAEIIAEPIVDAPAPVAVDKIVSVWPAAPAAAAAAAANNVAPVSDAATENEPAAVHSSASTAAAAFAAAAAAEEEAIASLAVEDDANDGAATAIPDVVSPATAITDTPAPAPQADEVHFSAAAAFESAVDSAVASTSGDDADDADDDEAAAPKQHRQNQKHKQEQPRAKPIDLADEELFPALGSPASSGKSATPWGSASGSMAQQLRLNQATEIVDLPMMQEPIADTVRKIMAATKTRIEVSNNAVLNTSTYLISGKPDGVARAKRDVCAKLSPRVSKTIQVPAVARSQLFGMRGRTLQTIQTQTGTTVTLGKPGTNNDADDEFAQIDVVIGGNQAGVVAAVSLIETLVDKRTTKRVVRLNDLPRDANAMLYGKGGDTLRALQATHPAVKIRIPGPIDADQVVRVLGDRDAAQAAAAAISDAARLLLQGSQTVTVSIPKRQHRFVVGDGGQTLRDIVDATGCSVLVPPPRSASDQVSVRGPEASLVQALGLVMAKANSVAVEAVDPTAIHAYARPLIYAQRVLLYLHDRNRFRRIESEHGVSVRAPSPAQTAAATSAAQLLIEIHASDARAAAAAAHALTTLLQAFPPSHFNGIDVEPHLHALLAGPGGTNVARLQTVRAVHTLFPLDRASSAVVVVYEGFNPDIDRIADPVARERAIRDLLRKTLEEFRAVVAADSSHVTRVVTVPSSLQEALATPAAVNALLAAAEADSDADGARVAVRLGLVAPVLETESTRSERKKNEGQLLRDQVEVKGLAAAVDRVVAELARRAQDAAERERLYAFTAEVTVPQPLMPRVVGRSRDNIKRLQTDHDIEVSIADNHATSVSLLTLKGRVESVAAARDELLAMIERLADQTADVISVAANIHKALIGAGGRYVKRLEDKYAVRIQFPSSRARAADKDKDSDRDAAVTALGPDQIQITGGRKGVDAAKAELLELAAYEIEHSHTVRFAVPAACLPYIVGRAGAHINEIKEESDTRIDLAEPADGSVEVTLVGTRAGTKIAREAIEAIVDEQKSQVDVAITVPVKHHRFLIGAGGARVRELVVQAGGDPDLMSGQRACRVQFPRASADAANDQVKLSGDSAIVDAVRARIEELVAERERMTTVLVSIPVSQHAFIIGRGGANLKQLQEAHSVEIFFPRSAARAKSAAKPAAAAADGESSQQPGPSDVRITGLPENCDACKAALLQLVREEATVTVPLALHQRLGGRHSALWRQVRAEFDVQVDAGRVDKAPARRVDQASAPGTQDEDLADSAPGRVVYRNVASDLAGLSAQWILRGEKSKLAQALELVNKQISGGASAVEARVNIDPRSHRFIIGKQGANIAKIRNMTGCEVDVPKKGNPSHWVTISGDRASIDHALDLINQCIEDRE